MWASDGIFYKKFYSIKKRDSNVSVSLFLCKLLTTQHANHLKPNILTPNTLLISIKTEKLWKNYYRKKATPVNQLQD